MSNEKQFYEITDAFLALRDIDDDAVENMLREERKSREAHIHEGKAFSVATGSKDLEAARKFIDEDAEDGDEIEVIDVDADTVDHIKKNAEYIGQGILCCNRCKANRFIDMDLLTVSEVDDELYNVDDECPHCHDAGAGYTLVGQVGKVQKEKPEEPVDAPEAELDNDEVTSDEATFDNDVEPEAEEVADEEPADEEELPEIETFEEEPEDDGMETNTSEDELDDLDLPDLGDEIDSDETEEDEDNVKESLHEDVQLNAMAEEAWMMNRVISAMNNEEAYFGSWLYTWPDGETREECAYDFGDTESFEDLQDTFFRTYKHYHADGLYDAAPEVVEYAHSIDRKLGLAKIENLAPIKPHVREAFECAVAGDIFNAITSPENVDKIIILDVSAEDAEPRKIFQGCKDDMPLNVVGSPCKSFDVADGYLSCNIDSDVENTNRPLNKALECFSDEKTDKVLIWDQAKGEEVFSGTKKDACDRFGNCEFISFETPAVIRINISNPGILSCDELEDAEPETDVSKLIKKIIDANNLSQYKTDKPNTNEYWIKACLEDNDDVELIYESFVKPTENKELIKEFKALTGYNNPLEAAYEAGYAAASINEDKEVVAKFAQVAAGYKGKGAPMKLDSANADTCSNCGGKLLAVDSDGIRKCQACGNKYVNGQPLFCTNCGSVEIDVAHDCKCKSCGHEFLKHAQCPKCGGEVVNGKCKHCGNVIHEAWMSRAQIIDELKYLGMKWRFNAYTDAQLFRMLQKERARAAGIEQIDDNAKCDRCGRRLNDGGTCPVCDDGEEHYDESLSTPVTLDDVKAAVDAEKAAPAKDAETSKPSDPATETDDKKVEAVQSFKSRKELAEAIEECKNNSRPYTIRRSTTEGYRYDLVTESINEDVEPDEVTSLVPAAAGEIEIVDDIPQQMPAEYSPQQRALMDQIHKVALDISDAINRHYNIEADPQIIVADIIRDLQLISGDVSVEDLGDSLSDRATAEFFRSYQEFYNFVDTVISDATGTPFVTTSEAKIRQAVRMLQGPNFSPEAIDRAIGSTAFIAAARSGNVPYIAASDIPLLEEAYEGAEDLDEGIFNKKAKRAAEYDQMIKNTFDESTNTLVIRASSAIEEVVAAITAEIYGDAASEKEQASNEVHVISSMVDKLKAKDKFEAIVNINKDAKGASKELSDYVDQLYELGSSSEGRAARDYLVGKIAERANSKLAAALTAAKSKATTSEELDESLEDLLSESVDIDTELFDTEMNSYFNESYDDTIMYTTTDGHIESDGTIVLEGVIQLDEVVKPITFTLDPETKITEDVEDREAAFESLMSETFKVTNNMSEEAFEFKFSK